ncbi:hypothetical protein M5689_003373 [Euphorbia peplus]|nr:hypothetical protein M5689_003373 [Euphorbia peplus]
MSWALGWKRPSETYRLTLNSGTKESKDDLNRTSTSSSTSFSSSSPSLPTSPVVDHVEQKYQERKTQENDR